MKIINPNKLKRGDLISIVSPSSGIANLFPERVKNGVACLKRMDFKVKVENNALKIHEWTSGTIKERVNDLHSAFKNKSVKAVICTIGGNHANQLLQHLDFKLIRNNPKIFLGFSDITVLHNAIYGKAGLRTFYGSTLMTEFGEYPDMNPFTREYFEKTFIDGKIGKIEASQKWTDEFLDWSNTKFYKKSRRMSSNKGYIWWRKGFAKGEVFGGCVPSLNHLLGTEYWVSLKNKILFIDLPEGYNPGENLSLSDVDAYLADLYNAGVFKEIKGLLIGRPYGYRNDKKKYEQLKEIIIKYTSDTNYPILFNADFGHTSPMITIPMGAKVEIDSRTNNFGIKGKYVD